MINRLKKSTFLTSIFTLASGSIIAQVVTILCSPLTTRLFSQQEIGVFTLITTAISMFAPILSFRYELSIVTEDNIEDMISTVKLSFMLCLLSSIIVAVGYMLYFKYISDIGYSSILASIYIFFLLILTGIVNILISFNNKMKEYKIMTYVYIIRTTAQNILMILFGVLSLGTTGLLTSQLLGLILGFKKQSVSLVKYKKIYKRITIKNMLSRAKKNIKMPLLSTPAIFANSFSYSSINMFIQYLFGSSVLGLYSISFRVLGLPLNIISNNVSKVYFERAYSEKKACGNFYHSTLKTILFVFFISFPMTIILIIFSPMLFKIVFGSEWIEAGIFVRILAPMFGIRFIASSLGTALIVANKQNYELIIQIILVLMSIIVFFITLVFKLSISLYLVMLSIFFSIIYLGYITVVVLFSRKGAN